ncbi:MAG: L-threonylcarbamoyladenylate synthase [Gammaproteobacteria bacterium]
MARHYSGWHLKRASQEIENGGVIGYPTETVYGLGCDPWNEKAVFKILTIKKRPVHKGLIVIAADISQLDPLINFPSQQIKAQIVSTWPGPFTWILPTSEHCPKWLSGQHDGLAVRVSSHPLCLALCKLTGPIVSTSANVANQPPAGSGWEVQMKFNDQLDYILHENLPKKVSPTSIQDAVTGKKIR